MLLSCDLLVSCKVPWRGKVTQGSLGRAQETGEQSQARCVGVSGSEWDEWECRCGNREESDQRPLNPPIRPFPHLPSVRPQPPKPPSERGFFELSMSPSDSLHAQRASLAN